MDAKSRASGSGISEGLSTDVTAAERGLPTSPPGDDARDPDGDTMPLTPPGPKDISDLLLPNRGRCSAPRGLPPVDAGDPWGVNRRDAAGLRVRVDSFASLHTGAENAGHGQQRTGTRKEGTAQRTRSYNPASLRSGGAAATTTFVHAAAFSVAGLVTPAGGPGWAQRQTSRCPRTPPRRWRPRIQRQSSGR